MWETRKKLASEQPSSGHCGYLGSELIQMCFSSIYFSYYLKGKAKPKNPQILYRTLGNVMHGALPVVMEHEGSLFPAFSPISKG